jgi:inosine-uridine nucleoside N-ribohydrolase
MKYLSFLILLTCSFTGFAQKPVPIIFDTDIAPDFDDVGAVAMLHAFQDQGEAKILAMISCNAFETTIPTLSVLNTYFKHPEIPLGIVKGNFPNKDCKEQWAQAILLRYPHSINFNEKAVEAVELYRKILAAQPDNSVTIISVGFFTNLSNLLASPKDKYSSMTGKVLIAKKVKQLVSMAAGVGKDGKGFREFNVLVDASATKKVFSEWPTPILISGFEIGEKVITGAPLTANENIQKSPVKDAYSIALAANKSPEGRNSWDQTAVLVAIKGYDPYFGMRKINFEIKDDGTSVVIPGEKFSYLTENMPPTEVAKVIEELMEHQPVKK